MKLYRNDLRLHLVVVQKINDLEDYLIEEGLKNSIFENTQKSQVAGEELKNIIYLSKKTKTGITGTLPLVQKAFETVGFAKVATSAKQAQSYGYLTGDDKIVVNRDHILSHAKDMVLDLSND